MTTLHHPRRHPRGERITAGKPVWSAGRGLFHPVRQTYRIGQHVRVICPECDLTGAKGTVVRVGDAALTNAYRYLVSFRIATRRGGVRLAAAWFGPAQLESAEEAL